MKWRQIKGISSKKTPIPGVDVPKGLFQSGIWDARDRKKGFKLIKLIRIFFIEFYDLHCFAFLLLLTSIFVCVGQSSAGSNWAKGYYTEGAELVDSVLDVVR